MIKRFSWLFGLLLVLAGVSYGQQITITGQVMDVNGTLYSGGSGNAVLVPQNQQWTYNGTNPVRSPVPIATMDSFGNFTLTLTSTAVIDQQSANPQWQISFCSAQYTNPTTKYCFTMAPLALATSQNITAIITPQAAILPIQGGGGGACTALGQIGDLQAKSTNAGNCKASHLNDGGTNTGTITSTEPLLFPQTGGSASLGYKFSVDPTSGSFQFDQTDQHGNLGAQGRMIYSNPILNYYPPFLGYQLTFAEPVELFQVQGALPVVGRFDNFPMPDPTDFGNPPPASAPIVSHSGAGGAGSPLYSFVCIDANSGISLPANFASDSSGYPSPTMSNYNTITYQCPPAFSNAAIFVGDKYHWLSTPGAGVISSLFATCGNAIPYFPYSGACTFNDDGTYTHAAFTYWPYTNSGYVVKNTSSDILSNGGISLFGGSSLGGGIQSAGQVSLVSLANPPAPTVTPNTTGATSASYYIVCYDYNGGISAVSPATTITNGNATPNNTITWNCLPGNATNINYEYAAILKGNTSTLLATVLPSAGSFTDTGQSTSVFSAPSRNTTGDGIAQHDFSVLSDLNVGTFPEAGRGGLFSYVTIFPQPMGTATSSTSYSSNAISFDGSVWNGTVAINDAFSMQDTPQGTGANPPVELNIFHVIGSSGAAWVRFQDNVRLGQVLGCQGTVSGVTNVLQTDSNGTVLCGTTTGGGGTGPTIATGGVNNAVQTTLNFIPSNATTDGLTVTPNNPATTGNEAMNITGTTLPIGGGTGVSSPTAHTLPIAEGASNFTFLPMNADTILQGQGSGVDPAPLALTNCVGANAYNISAHNFACNALPGNTPGVSHEWISAYNNGTGNFTLTQPDFTDLSGTGNVVLNNQANTYSTGLQDFSAVTLKIPASGTFTSSPSSTLGIATTTGNLHAYLLADSVIPSANTPGSWVNGDCAEIYVSSGQLAIADAGGVCSTGSTTAFANLTAGTNTHAGTFAATGNTWDFSGVTLFKLRVGAALTTSANGDIGYDTTNKMWHGYQNGSDSFFFQGLVSGTFTNNDCPKISVASSQITLVDSGAGCGGLGTVTSFSAGNANPFFTTAVSTATTTPALSFAISTQLANCVFAGPTSGSAATPTCRALVAADIPTGISITGNAATATAAQTTPTLCSTGQAPTGITATFNATGCAALGISGLTVGTTTVSGGTTQFILFNNGGVLGNEAVSSLNFAGSQITSSAVGATFGGTGIDSHTSTGVAQVSSGTWSISTALANGTTATTQTAGDNTTKVATDQFVLSNAITNPMTTIGDRMGGGTVGAVTRIPAGLTGQVDVETNGATGGFASAGVPGRTVSGTTDTILCDSSTATLDRATTIAYTSTSNVAITVPSAAATGCGSGTQGDHHFAFAVLIAPASGTSTYTFTPTTSTLTIVDGTTVTTGATSVVLSLGQFATFTSPDDVNYLVRLTKGGSGLSGLTTNAMLKATSSTTAGNSSCSDNGTTVSCTEPITAGGSGTTALITTTTANQNVEIASGNGSGSDGGTGTVIVNNLVAPTYATGTVCANGASPAVCGSAAAGSVAVPTGATPTLVIDTSAVTAASQIFLTIDESATISGITCNTTLATLVQPVVTARTAGTSFTIQINATLATHPACVSYHIMN